MAEVITGPYDNKENLIATLRDKFEDELLKIRENDKIPKMHLKKLELHITTLFHLLMIWTQYTDVIYSPETVIQAMKFSRLNMEKSEAIEHQGHQEYIKKILKTSEKAEDIAYHTVEEGITTDTTDSSEEEVEKSTVKEEPEEEVTSFGDDGLLGQLMAQEEGDDISDEEIKSFANQELDLDSSRKEEIKFDYKIGESDLKDFKARIEQKGRFARSKNSPTTSMVSNTDMFGIQDSSRQKDETQIEEFIKQQLEEISENLGAAENDFSNYIPNSGLDPFQPPASLTETIIKNNNTSIVMDVFHERLRNLPEVGLTKNELETKKKLLKLADYISGVRILDAPVLAEIYEMYKFK